MRNFYHYCEIILSIDSHNPDIKNMIFEINYKLKFLGKHFIRDFDESNIENIDYVKDCINGVLEKIEDIKYLMNKDDREFLTNEFTSLKSRLKL